MSQRASLAPVRSWSIGLVMLLLAPVSAAALPVASSDGTDTTMTPGGVYEGTTLGAADGARPTYTFEAHAGQTLSIVLRGGYDCGQLTAPSGPTHTSLCTVGGQPVGAFHDVPLSESGTYHLVVGVGAPDHYKLGFNLDGPAPSFSFP